jgi:SAM-dependent methyltransferase
MQNCKAFIEAYHPFFPDRDNLKIVEIGSQDVNGTLRDVAPPGCEYVGIDFVEGKGVDVVLDDPYKLPLEDESADIVLSSSCFEHSEMFWLVFLEIMRVLKARGLFYLNAPSNGQIHRYPVDCWRFYPDSGSARATWAKRNGINAALLESYTSCQTRDYYWNDFVAVFVKDEKHAANFPERILDKNKNIFNGIIRGIDASLNETPLPEDRMIVNHLYQQLSQRAQPQRAGEYITFNTNN